MLLRVNGFLNNRILLSIVKKNCLNLIICILLTIVKKNGATRHM